MSVNKFGSSFSRSGDGDVAKGVDKSYVDNAFLWKHGDVMKGTIDMSNNRIFNLPPPVDANDPKEAGRMPQGFPKPLFSSIALIFFTSLRS